MKEVATNKKAFHDFSIEERCEAGVCLMGTEVKSLRERRISLRESFARVEGGDLYLYNCHISPYDHGNISNHDPLRRRRLLLHRGEIERLAGKTQMKGYTLIPLRVYFKNGWAKVELGLAKGKKLYDRREELKKEAQEREVQKVLKSRRR